MRNCVRLSNNDYSNGEFHIVAFWTTLQARFQQAQVDLACRSLNTAPTRQVAGAKIHSRWSEQGPTGAQQSVGASSYSNRALRQEVRLSTGLRVESRSASMGY